jgi:hypothetical protein
VKITRQRDLMLIVTVFVLMTSMFNTRTVFADDGTPPVEPAPTEEPVIVDQPTVEPAVEEASSGPVSEILEQLPENTELIALNESGDAEPLVTEQAAEIISSSDPIWCPAGQAPGDTGCTASYTTVTALIANLGSKSGAGTIYFTSDYSTNDVVFDRTNANLVLLTDLTIQGGWNGLTGVNYSLSGDTTFTGVGLAVTNWVGNVTINDVNVNNANGDGITVFNEGDIELVNVNVQNSLSSGAGVSLNNGFNWGTGFNISLSDVDLENNTDNGLYALYVGDISLDNVTISGNNGTGAHLNNTSGSGDFNLTGTNIFNNNNGDGLFIASDGTMNLENVTANNNQGTGVSLDNTGGNGVILTGTNVFESNGSQGLGISSNGDVSVNNITASQNGYTGAALYGANVTLNGNNTFNNNLWAGAQISGGTAIVNNVSAGANATTGIEVYGGTGDIILTNMNTFSNGGHGLYINSSGNIQLNDIASTGNAGFGAEIYNYSGATANVIIDDGTFSDNQLGATILSAGNVTLSRITSNGNTLYGGVNINNLFGSGDVAVSDSDFSNNESGGLGVTSFGDVSISNIAANGNGASGAYLEMYGGQIVVSASQFNSNAYYGIDAEYTTGTLVLNAVSFDCLNGLGSYYYNGTVFDVCGTSQEEGQHSRVEGGSLPLNLVLVSNEEIVQLDCEQFSGTVLVLPDGNKTTFKCPVDGSGSVTTLTADGLPGDLPEGVEFVSGMGAGQSPDGNDIALDGFVIMSFLIPEGVASADLAILYWNGTEWVDLASTTFEDGREVIDGGHKTDNGYFEAAVNFSGVFVLVTK